MDTYEIEETKDTEVNHAEMLTEELAEAVQAERKERHHKNKKKHSAKEAREMFMNRKKRMVELDVSLPDLEDLDDELGILELTAKDIETAQNLSKGPDGEMRELEMTAGMIVRGLVMIDTREPVFTKDDIGYIVENFGLTIIQPLGMKIQKVNNLSGDALEEAKKNLQKAQGSGQATSSGEK